MVDHQLHYVRGVGLVSREQAAQKLAEYEGYLTAIAGRAAARNRDVDALERLLRRAGGS